jgi:hypothetical protein
MKGQAMAFDKHVPMPTRDKAAHPRFRDMAVGDSVFVPHPEGSIMKCRAYLYATTISKRDKTFRFAGRTTIENGVRGVRIWRV